MLCQLICQVQIISAQFELLPPRPPPEPNNRRNIHRPDCASTRISAPGIFPATFCRIWSARTKLLMVRSSTPFKAQFHFRIAGSDLMLMMMPPGPLVRCCGQFVPVHANICSPRQYLSPAPFQDPRQFHRHRFVGQVPPGSSGQSKKVINQQNSRHGKYNSSMSQGLFQ